MAQYFEDRLGKAVTTAWNLNVKDIEQTISEVCKRVCFLNIDDTCPCAAIAGRLVSPRYTCDCCACNHVDMCSGFTLAQVYHGAIDVNEALHYMSPGLVAYAHNHHSHAIPMVQPRYTFLSRW